MERDAKNPKPKATSGRNTKVDCKTQTEADSRQRDWLSSDIPFIFHFLLYQHKKHLFF